MKKKKQLYPDSTSKWIIVIAILFSSVIPLLIRVIAINYPMDQFVWYPNETTFYDSFSLFKSQAIIFTGVLALGLLFYRQYKNKVLKIKDPVIISAFILIVLLLLSHILSVNSWVSSKGYLERYESTWVWLSYLIVFLLIYSYKWKVEDLKKVSIAFISANVILSIIGLMQYFGIDLIFNDFMKPLITGMNMKNINFTANSTISYDVIVQTLYHYNYVGHFIALSFPVILSMAIYEKRMIKKISLFILVGMITLNLLGSSARGGLIAVLATLPLVLIINYKTIFKYLKFAIALALTFIILFVGFEAYSNQFITKRLQSIFTSVETPNKLRDIVIDNDSILINLEGSLFRVNVISQVDQGWEVEYLLDDSYIEALDADSDGKLDFKEPVLKNVEIYVIKQNDHFLFTIDIYGTPWYFGFNDNILMYVNPFGNFDTITNADSIGFEGKERLGSARGYIWSRSIPVALENPFLGHGPDTFALVFPQNDYIGKYNAYNTNNMVVDKPHNLFLQIALNSGVIALGAYLILFIILGKRFITSWISHHRSFDNVYLSAFALSISSYFIASFFNDSAVHVSPVFWVFFGLSLQLSKPNKNIE